MKQIKVRELQQHISENQLEHVAKKLDFVTNKQNETILQLQTENEELKRKVFDITSQLNLLNDKVFGRKPLAQPMPLSQPIPLGQRAGAANADGAWNASLSKHVRVEKTEPDKSEFVWSSQDRSDDIHILDNKKTITLYPKRRPSKYYNTILLNPAIQSSGEYVFLFEFSGALRWDNNTISIGLVRKNYSLPFMGEKGIGFCLQSYGWNFGEAEITMYHMSDRKETFLNKKLKNGGQIRLTVQNSRTMILHLGDKLVGSFTAHYPGNRIAVTMGAGVDGKQLSLKLLSCTYTPNK